MTLEIWFEFGSTYSYLTVARAEPLLKAAGIDWRWQPFLLGPILEKRGLATSPFVLDRVKGAHMWRDLERRAARYGLPFVRPPLFPMNGVRAARIMTAGLGEPWCGDFARQVFAAEFARGADIAETAVLADALVACGADPARWLARAQQNITKTQLREATDRAWTLGLFGAPSFVVGDELFWGDDRLEDAIAWATETRR